MTYCHSFLSLQFFKYQSLCNIFYLYVFEMDIFLSIIVLGSKQRILCKSLAKVNFRIQSLTFRIFFDMSQTQMMRNEKYIYIKTYTHKKWNKISRSP